MATAQWALRWEAAERLLVLLGMVCVFFVWIGLVGFAWLLFLLACLVFDVVSFGFAVGFGVGFGFWDG